MKVLITGNQGFVGQHFQRRFAAHHIVGIDIKTGHDCRDFFRDVDSQFDLVIHCAAIVGGRANIEGSPLAVATNLGIDAAFFQWCLRTHPKQIVYFSSSAVYPIEYQVEGNQRLLKEEMQSLEAIRNPDLTYGWAKLVGEYLASFVPNVHIFRPFSGYGDDQDLSYPFPAFIRRALLGRDPFEIWGTGMQTRDFIHIDDIVDAVLQVIATRGADSPMNLGTGRSTSFLDLARMVTSAAQYNPRLLPLADMPSGCMHRVADIALMSDFYTPRITLEEGIDRAIFAMGKRQLL